MANVVPFRGLRPKKELVDKVASPPYDVLNSAEARQMAGNNPHSFLRINKPEIDLDPSVDPYDDSVYRKGAENLKRMTAEGTLFQDDAPCYYVYRQQMGDHIQTGLVAGASVAEYEQDLIKKHELTRPVKEDDRVKHIDYQNAQVGPVFLTYNATGEIDSLIADITAGTPEYDFHSDDEVRHTFWVVNRDETIEKIRDAFSRVPCLYVADGHHRSAAATRIKQMRAAKNETHSGDESYNFFLTVIFPHNQMQILDYNRIVKDLNGKSAAEFLGELEKVFTVRKVDSLDAAKPARPHSFGMFLENQWYSLQIADDKVDENDPVARLDVSILQEQLLGPLLNIVDQRKDVRIDFVGGIRGLKELEGHVKSGNWAAAFAFYPTSIEDLMAIADAGEIMPPKSTWFEPKLRTGMVVHLLD